jgi:hypothetical protein
MISAVLYGRNDNYGYNLHKRAALSFNCIAEVLTEKTDEIIFVDYNTPDDFPTFPEAIQDTLTEKTRGMLRVLRVRPAIHERFKNKTGLVAIEPVARNVGVLRSRAENRWILSTNTDMIFVPAKGGGISRLVSDLPKGFYHAPRIEIPETLWESFDRKDPTGIIDKLKIWSQALHLNEIVLGADTILYDAPGDFQLIERKDLLANHGFNEDMLLGWHVDSNIAKRLFLKYGKVGDLGRDLFGYHCDHTRQITPMHSHSRTENDARRFIDLVTRADLPAQADAWGCPNDPIEEITLRGGTSHVYVRALEESIGAPMLEPTFVGYQGATYGKTDYDPRHVMPFLADLFAASPRDLTVGWYGGRHDTLAMFAKVWRKLGLKGAIYCDEMLREDLNFPGADVEFVSAEAVLDRSNAFVFDFGSARDHKGVSRGGGPDQRIKKMLRGALKDLATYERVCLREGKPARRIIGLDVIHNDFENLFHGLIGVGLTPFSTRLRHGYVLPAPEFPMDWLPQLSLGPNGVRTTSGIANTNASEGLIAYGPYKYIPAGRYTWTLVGKVSGDDEGLDPNLSVLLAEVVIGGAICGRRYLSLKDLKNESCSFAFQTAETEEMRGVEIRLLVLASVPVEVQKLIIRDAEQNEELGAINQIEIRNLLPIVSRAPGVVFESNNIKVPKSTRGFAVFGPYLTMAPGFYKLVVTLERDDVYDGDYLGYVDVAVQNRVIAQLQVRLDRLVRAPIRLYVNFEVPANTGDGLIETRVWSSGEVAFKINSFAIVRQAAAIALPAPRNIKNSNWLPYLALNTFTYVDEQGVHVAKGQVGHVVAGPYWPLKAGRYKLIAEITMSGQVLDKKLLGQAEIVAFFGTLNVGSREIWTPDPKEHLSKRTAYELRKALRPLLNLARKTLQYFPSLRGFAGVFKRWIVSLPMLRPPDAQAGRSLLVIAEFTFEISEALADKPMIETRIWSTGEVGFCLKSLAIKTV